MVGVDKFADSAVVIKARIKTRPIKQWSVGREFNRRMKIKSDELGIEIPYPHTTLFFGENKSGSTAAAKIESVTQNMPSNEPAKQPSYTGTRPEFIDIPSSADGESES